MDGSNLISIHRWIKLILLESIDSASFQQMPKEMGMLGD
jgi:hypothetical protein